MTPLPTLLTRPSALSTIAIVSTAAFYLGMKSRAVVADQTQRGAGDVASREGEREGTVSARGEAERDYGVRAGRSGGGV